MMLRSESLADVKFSRRLAAVHTGDPAPGPTAGCAARACRTAGKAHAEAACHASSLLCGTPAHCVALLARRLVTSHLTSKDDCSYAKCILAGIHHAANTREQV